MDYIIKKQNIYSTICNKIAYIIGYLRTSPAFVAEMLDANDHDYNVFDLAKAQERTLVKWFNKVCAAFEIPLSMSTVTPGPGHAEDLKFGDIRVNVKKLTPLMDHIYCDLKVGKKGLAGAIDFRSFSNFTLDGIYITMDNNISKCYIIRKADLDSKLSELTWSYAGKYNYTVDQVVADTNMMSKAYLGEIHNYGDLFANCTIDKLADLSSVPAVNIML